MTYLSGKAQKRRRSISYVLFGALFIVIVLFWPLWKKNVYPLLAPALGEYAEIKTSFKVLPEFFYTYFTSHRELVKKDKALEIQIENLENQLAEKDALTRELSARILEIPSKDGVIAPPVVMYPLAQDITRLYSTILLSKGYKEGIDIGDVVFVRGRQAVCTIKEVYTSSSLCLILSSSGVTSEGVTSSSSVALSLLGRGGYYLGSVARDTPIHIGEVVYMREDPSMILGTVVDVSHNNQDTSWYIFVRGAYNPVHSSIFYVQ